MAQWSIRDNMEAEGDCPRCRGTGLTAFGHGPPTLCSCENVEPGDAERVARRRTHHLQVMARAGGYVSWVDELLAPFLEQAWQAGFGTYASCQKGEQIPRQPAGLLAEGMVLTDRDSAWPLTDLWQWPLGSHLSVHGSDTTGLVSLTFPPVAAMADQSRLHTYLEHRQDILRAMATGRAARRG